MNKYSIYPVFLSIGGKLCVVVGGGDVALRKVRELLEADADVTVVAEIPSREIAALSKRECITLKTKRFEPSDVKGAFLVFAATNDKSANAEIASAAGRNKSLVNVVDTPELCEFFSGAVVKRGPLKIAVSTSGCCPGIAKQIRGEIEECYPESFTGFIETAGEIRQYILSRTDIDDFIKQDTLSWLAQKETRTIFFKHGKEKIWEELRKLISC